MQHPFLHKEKQLWRKGFRVVVGLDEVGRGPLAGPVVAAAVLVNPKFKIRAAKVLSREMKDSKKLTPKKRKILFALVKETPEIAWGVGRVSERVIDRVNILEATKLAMKRAVKNLERNAVRADFLIIDGTFTIQMEILQEPIIKADEKIFSCMLASIIAKVTRDRIMERYHKKYPQYGFDSHKGYGTKLHVRQLERYGPSVIHRKTFTPVNKMIQ